MALSELRPSDLRKFGLTLALALAVIFGLILPWLRGGVLPWWPWICAGLLSGWALLAPSTLRPLYKFWMKVGSVLGRINAAILLTLVFYVVFLPIGLLRRLVNRDTGWTFDKTLDTYRINSGDRLHNHVERPF